MLHTAAPHPPSQMSSGSSEGAVPARSRGFTLIELMIAVGIVAILAAIAYPSYLRYTVRSNRAAAQSYLMDAAQRQQQFLMDSRAYATTYTALNDTPSTAVTNFYTVTFATDGGGGCTPAPCFILQAAPVTGTMQASDGTLTIDNTGRKSPTSLW